MSFDKFIKFQPSTREGYFSHHQMKEAFEAGKNSWRIRRSGEIVVAKRALAYPLVILIGLVEIASQAIFSKECILTKYIADLIDWCES